MSFHSPHLLWLLVPLVLLFSWELARHTANAATTWPKIARAWAGAFDVSLGARHTTAENRPRLWLWFGLTLCLVALARPQWGVLEEQVFDQSREVLIALDLSKSMLTPDVKPSRLERSKLLITSLLDGLKGERVGLVCFSGTAFLQSPLSADYEILREFLPALNTDFLPEGGTNYRSLLETSIQAFGSTAADRYLIILSDGEATDDDWKPLIDSLKEKGIRVIGLGVGTAGGGFIPDGSGGFVKDERGAVVLSHLESATLQELAQTTGGAYADASSWVDLAALLHQTVDAGQKGQFSEKSTARLIERYQWFLAPGVLLLLFSFWAEFPVRPRERALPVGRARPRQPAPAAASTALASLVALLAFLGRPAAARADDVMAKPLSTTVSRLAGQDNLSARDCAELAETTVTYGQRTKTSEQPPSEGALRDGLAAVDQGEQLDAKAADWPKLRQELQELLKKSEPPKKDQQKQDPQKQDQNQNRQQNQQNQNQNQPQQSQQKQNQSSQDQQSQSQQQQNQSQTQPTDPQQKQNQEAFGDMKDQQPKPQPQAAPKPPPEPAGTQKVGGQKEKPVEPADQELAVPLQKLEQVKNEDAPVRLQQLLQGPQEKPQKPGKDW